jgi:hypothetical protein
MRKRLATVVHRCGVKVWTGHEAERSGALPYVIETRALTPREELEAVASGLMTYCVHLNGDVHARTAEKIRLRIAGVHPRMAVHPEHRCPGTEGQG